MYLSGKIGLTSISWRCLGKKDQLQLTEEVWKKKGLTLINWRYLILRGLNMLKSTVDELNKFNNWNCYICCKCCQTIY